MTEAQAQAALGVLCGSYATDVADGTVRLIFEPLPGKAVCAILPDFGDGVLRVVCDLEKPDVLAHTRAMLREAYESVVEPVAFPDGTVELLRRPCPPANTARVELAVTV